MRWVGSCVALAAGLMIAGQACASLETFEYTISASNFQAYSGPLPAPADPVLAQFEISFDPTVIVDPTTVGLTVDALNIPYVSAAFSYDPLGGGLLWIATHPTIGGGFAITGPTDFGFLLTGSQTAHPTMAYAQYFTSDFGNYYTTTGTVTVTAVPEPLSWSLLVAGFGIIGAGLRGRRRHRAMIALPCPNS